MSWSFSIKTTAENTVEKISNCSEERAKGVYFKGRAIMAENHLYLLAMECDVSNYQEGNFNHFINSFELVK